MQRAQVTGTKRRFVVAVVLVTLLFGLGQAWSGTPHAAPAAGAAPAAQNVDVAGRLAPLGMLLSLAVQGTYV